jgi:hypothetical protein
VPATNGQGPHRLTAQTIDEVVTRTCAGNYALGRVQENGYSILYVGRCKDDVAKRLRF